MQNITKMDVELKVPGRLYSGNNDDDINDPSIIMEPEEKDTLKRAKETKQTPPYVIFMLHIILAFVIMVGRSVIAGGSTAFSVFCITAPDAPTFVQNSPSAGVGLLVSIFIAGYSISMIFMSHLTYVYKWKPLMLCAIGIWIVAVFLSGFAGYINSFRLLLFSQMTTGVTESIFQVIAPTLIEGQGGSHSGKWMSIFCCTTPLGLVVGYIYGAYVTSALHWSWCFYILSSFNVPIFIAFALVRDDVNDGFLIANNNNSLHDKNDVNNSKSNNNAKNTTKQPKFTVWEEMAQCLRNKVLCTIVFGDAMQMASTTVVATFSASFLLILELYDDPKTATVTFGAVVAFAGVLGSLFGGYYIDKSMNKIVTPSSQVVVNRSFSNDVLALLLPRISFLVILSLCFLLPTCIQNVSTFIMFLLYFFGWFFIFSIQTMIMVCTLHAVEVDHRPSAIAFQKFMRHILGDVPAPIIFGLIKDYLAPACVFSSSGEFTDKDDCKEQQQGILVTLALCYAYLGLSVFFFQLGHWFICKEIKLEKELERIAGSSDVSVISCASSSVSSDCNKEL